MKSGWRQECPDCGAPLSREPWARGLCVVCLGDLGFSDTLSRLESLELAESPERRDGDPLEWVPVGASGSWTTLTSLAPKHLREVRHLWAYALICVLALYALSGSVYWIATVGGTVDVGAMVLPEMRVRAVRTEAARQAGIEPRDRILAVDGEAVFTTWELQAALNEAGPGTEVVLTVERAPGDRRLLRLPTNRGGTTLFSWQAFTRGAIWVLSGILLFWFHPGRRESWAFLLATSSVGLPALLPLPDYFGGNYLPLPHLAGRGWTVGIEGLIGPACLWFFLVFPYPPSFLARRLRWIGILFVPAGLWAAIFLPTYPWYPRYPQVEPIAETTYRALAGLTPLAVLLSIGVLVWRYRQPQPPRQATQLRALTVASALSFPVPVFVYALTTVRPQLWGELHGLMSLGLNVPLFIFPPMVAYAIARHDLFRIDRLVARASAYSVAIALVALVFAAAAILLPSVLAPEVLGDNPALMALVMFVAISVLRPIELWVRRRIERRLGVRDVDPERKVRGVREALRALRVADPQSAFGEVERLVEQTLGLDRMVILGRSGERWLLPARSAEGAETLIADPLSDLGLSRIVEIKNGDELIGGLGIGKVSQGRESSPEDDLALEVLAREAGHALTRSEPGQRIGDYRVIRQLASGGMGTVYLAVRRGVGGFAKQVAVKELLPDQAADLDMISRFVNEAKVAATLVHPNIVQTYDLGQIDRGFFIAMEYVPGLDLGTLMAALEDQGSVLPVPCAVYIGRRICLALDYAHDAADESGRPWGLVHRDVSPQNVLLSTSGEVKLTDFGVAQLGAGEREGAEIVGKIPYMAPEQLRGERVDHRADLFAAGLVLYELCTGVHPFRRAGRRRTRDAILRGEVMAPETLRPAVSSELSRAILKSLATRPEKRFATGGAMLEALQSKASDELRTQRAVSSIVQHVLAEHAAAGSERTRAAPRNAARRQVKTLHVDL